MKLSIIIVAYNVKDYLKKCLDSIFNFVSEIDYEVVVVDNASSDGSSEMILKNYPRVKLIANEENLGFGKANNIGMMNCHGDTILLLNSDAELVDNSLIKAVDYLVSNPDVGVLGCKLLNPDGTVQTSTHGYPTLIKEVVKLVPLLRDFVSSSGLLKRILVSRLASFIFSSHVSSLQDYEQLREVEEVTGAFFLVKRRVIEDVGMFDENFFVYIEEADWCLRIRQKGWKVIYFPDTKAVHYVGKTMDQPYQRQKANWALRERYRSLVYFFRKHYSWFKVFLLKVFVTTGFSVRALTSIIAILFKPHRYKDCLSDSRVYCRIVLDQFTTRFH